MWLHILLIIFRFLLQFTSVIETQEWLSSTTTSTASAHMGRGFSHHRGRCRQWALQQGLESEPHLAREIASTWAACMLRWLS